MPMSIVLASALHMCEPFGNVVRLVKECVMGTKLRTGMYGLHHCA